MKEIYQILNSDTTLLCALQEMVIDDSKSPWGTAAPGTGQSKFISLKKIDALIRPYIDKYKEEVGIVYHHCGMGYYTAEIVLVKELDQEQNP